MFCCFSFFGVCGHFGDIRLMCEKKSAESGNELIKKVPEKELNIHPRNRKT